MPLDAYSSCPCGSGKKFKWCCQPIHAQIDRAYRQQDEGQHEAALRIMDEVVAQHPANPEVYGRKAQLLYQNNRADDAETTLQKALDINPNYPFGHFLRGMFRHNEGEIPGSLLLFRKAVDLYDPEARDYLGQIYWLIFDCELKLNRPVAAHAAARIAVHHVPGNEEMRKTLEGMFGAENARLPAVARKQYSFEPSPAAATTDRREAWNRAVGAASKLSDAVRAFEQLTRDDETDAAAWFNLALARAWVGDNRAAIEALEKHIALEGDENKAAVAAALGEVLRCGHGMDEHTDYVEYSLIYPIRQPEAFLSYLDELHREGRFLASQVNHEQGLITGLLMAKKTALTPELAATQLAKVGAYVMVVVDHVRLWHTNAAALAQVREELQQRLGPALGMPRSDQGVAGFTDLLVDMMALPDTPMSKEEAAERMRKHHEAYFEEKWIHQPRKSLNQIPPVDAAGHAGLRKKLKGIVQFIQECAVSSPAKDYDFDRLRRKLGLLDDAAPAAAGPEIGSMSTAELAGLSVEQLTDESLEQAYQAALKLDAREVAGKFAQALVALPARPGKPRDRYPWYSHLLQLAMGAGDLDSALSLVDAGEKADCEENEGRRRNDYELRRAQLHAKRGATDAAHEVFERLVQRAPDELRYCGSATEAMLSAKQGARALVFAEKGLAKAREKNNRDLEQYFLELVHAAKKLQT